MGRKIQKNLPHAFETNEAEKISKKEKCRKPQVITSTRLIHYHGPKKRDG